MYDNSLADYLNHILLVLKIVWPGLLIGTILLLIYKYMAEPKDEPKEEEKK